VRATTPIALTLSLLLAAAAGAVEVRQSDGAVSLSNGRIDITALPDGMLSAAVLHDGQRADVLRGGISQVLLRGQQPRNLLADLRPELGIGRFSDSFGTGRSIELTYRTPEATVRVVHILYEGTELFTTEVFITASRDIAVTGITVLSGDLDLGAGEVRVLSNPREWDTRMSVLGGRESRSIFCSALYNRQSGRGAVLGAMSGHASSMVRSRMGSGGPHFALFTEYGGPGAGELRIAAGQTARSGAHAVGLPADIFEGLEAYGAAVRKYNNIRLYDPIPAGWCSWDAFNWIMQEKQIYDTIEKIKKLRLAEYGFNVLQIDDGWQRGWRCSGDWQYNPNRFPNGIRPIAEAAKEAGFTLGLWIGPFSDEDFRSSGGPDGSLREGAPGWMRAAVPVLLNYPELMTGYAAGRPSGHYDLSLPAFKEHLTSILRRLTGEYGASYIKADFVKAGDVEHDRSLPYHDIYRNALLAMRAGMPPNTYLMTCVSPDWKGLGIVDGQRIGDDVSTSWRGINPTLLCAAGRYFTNGNFWWNDPDQLHVVGGVDAQGRQHGLTMDQARAWAALVALYGGVTLTGDPITELSEERTKLFTQCLPPTGQTARPLDLFDVITEQSPQRHSSLWALRIDKPFGAYHVAAAFNWTNAAAQRTLDLGRLGIAAGQRLVIYDYWNSALIPAPADGKLVLDTAPTSCRLLVIHGDDGQPRLLSSDRHLVSGAVDVIDVSRQDSTLRGRSQKLVSGVPFKYSFYVPAGQRLVEATFDGRPGQVEMRGENLAVVTFTPSQPTIEWMVRFAAP